VSAAGPPSDWARLFRMACALIRQVNANQLLIDHWAFGGGTALMLQIDHRESRDVDIFLSDPQLLPLLDPEKRDFQFETSLSDSRGDGSGFLKLAFDGVGEIDFIVAAELTAPPTRRCNVEGESVLLETVPEIITKKIHYRGTALKPRDVFDIAAAGERYASSMIEALKPYRDDVVAALAKMARLNPEFVNAAIAQLLIKEGYAAIARTSFDRAREILRAV
jgi:hypothetical protein